MPKEQVVVISLFNGISVGRHALDTSKFEVLRYYSSEIDKYAIQISNYLYPQDMSYQLGSVLDIDTIKLLFDIKLEFPGVKIMLVGGSPCQSFSLAGKRNGASTTTNIDVITLEQYLQLKSEGFEFVGQSYLFWEYMRILTDIQPDYFLLENVSMTKYWKDILSEAIGVEPVVINSSLLTAQNRKRLYWVGSRINGKYVKCDIPQPDDKKIFLKDIMLDSVDGKHFYKQSYIPTGKQIGHVADVCIKGNESIKRVYSIDSKSPTLTTMQGGHRHPKVLVEAFKPSVRNNITREYAELVKSTKMLYQCKCTSGFQDNKCGILKSPTLRANNPFTLGLTKNKVVRRLVPQECEILQGLPVDYTKYGFDNVKQIKVNISDSQRYKTTGNGWTSPVITHILNNM
jgi:DNA (cytosine-5)-methyltransferase 3A